MCESLGTLKPGWTAGVYVVKYTVLMLLVIGMYACFRWWLSLKLTSPQV